MAESAHSGEPTVRVVRVSVCGSALSSVRQSGSMRQCVAVCGSVWQCVAVCGIAHGSVWQ